jgi:hypothetical protein
VDIIRAAFIEIFEDCETPIVLGSQSKCHPVWNLFVLFLDASLPWFTGFAVEYRRPSDLTSLRVGVPKYGGTAQKWRLPVSYDSAFVGGQTALRVRY